MEDLDATVEIIPRSFDENGVREGYTSSGKVVVSLGADNGIRKYSKYKIFDRDADSIYELTLAQSTEYYDNGNIKHKYVLDLSSGPDFSTVYIDHDYFYDEQGKVIVYTYKSIAESYQREYTYNADGSEKRVYNIDANGNKTLVE